MPGVWLGENTVPELTELSDDLIRFGHDTTRSLWPGLLVVAGFGIPCIMMCTVLALYGEGPVNPVFMKLVLFAFTVTVISVVSYACWCVDATVINTRTRTVTREYYFIGKKFWYQTIVICDDDFLAVTTTEDEHGTGCFHRIYLCRTKPLFLFSAIHFPSTKPCDNLLRVMDELAFRLRIENRGYIGWRGFLNAWTRYLIRKT
ncbi:hypothetical protein VN12_04035 [Pirellula sp. SH-Sr6A]|uniref:hypothetical protein n=1 Tax=Pirellula sp. SH-Sr6A TaxID=1632865 RepID=UPI00078E2E19|nr:hypothetical protein [Pirellula sp. SH-Sr6A]AMV31264.1 hypothetical protein VN12_04035 [Pirellula sp. SH-Sr6A]